MSSTDYGKLLGLDPDEVVTHAIVRDVALRSGRTLALITLDNGRGRERPSTLGATTLHRFGLVLDGLADRAAAGEIDAVGVTGRSGLFSAGADLSKVGDIPDRETGWLLARLGHETLGKLGTLGVPSFVYYNGTTLGGGVEVGLNATYRTIDASVRAFASPEVFLGLIPGWGGSWLLPNLIGIDGALELIVENPLKNNRMVTGPQAFAMGIADAIFPSVNFLEDSLAWTDGVLTGALAVSRPNEPGPDDRGAGWDAAIDDVDGWVASRVGRVAKSPYRALELLRAAKTTDRTTGFAAEDDALTDLIADDQFRASVYAHELVQKRARRPAGAPDAARARPVRTVGIIGAGLMASQFALLFLRRLEVPILITDLDQQRVDAAVAGIRRELDDLLAKGRIGADEANRLRASITGTTDMADFAGCDWVIEAVFEDLGVKQQVVAEVEKHLAPEAILATNTSSLSVEQIGAKLEHPQRLVGFHFFNPVAAMALIEVVTTPITSDAALSTAMVIAARLGKSAVITTDTPGFVVNRILAKFLSEAMHAVEQGTPFETVIEAVEPLGLPMDPFVLLDLIGLRVGAHVLDTHHAAFPDRFYDSPALHDLADAGVLLARDAHGAVTGIDEKAVEIVAAHHPDDPTIRGGDELRVLIEDGLADEIHRMLQDRVVAGPEDIDLCMILGAGWPLQMGGATPYLDRCGASDRAFGGAFHTPRIVGVA